MQSQPYWGVWDQSFSTIHCIITQILQVHFGPSDVHLHGQSLFAERSHICQIWFQIYITWRDSDLLMYWLYYFQHDSPHLYPYLLGYSPASHSLTGSSSIGYLCTSWAQMCNCWEIYARGAAIPFIVHPIDNAIHALLNFSLRPAMRKLVCGLGQGSLAELEMCGSEECVPVEAGNSPLSLGPSTSGQVVERKSGFLLHSPRWVQL